MKKTIMALVTILALAVMVLGGCSSSDNKKKDPIYPACETNDHCASHNQVCLNGNCVECIKDANCGKCESCKNNACEKIQNCCGNDKDCAQGSCMIPRGSKTGTCK